MKHNIIIHAKIQYSFIQFPKFHAKHYYCFDVMTFIHLWTIIAFFHQFSSMNNCFSFIKLNLKHNILARQEHNFSPHFQKFCWKKKHSLSEQMTDTHKFLPHTSTHTQASANLHQNTQLSMVASICEKYGHFIKFAGNTYKCACNQLHYIRGVEKYTHKQTHTHTHTHTHTNGWLEYIYVWLKKTN